MAECKTPPWAQGPMGLPWIPNASLVAFKQKGMKRPAAAPKELKRPAAAKKPAARPAPSATSSAEEQNAAEAANEPAFERTYRMEDYLPKGTRKYGSLGTRQISATRSKPSLFPWFGIDQYLPCRFARRGFWEICTDQDWPGSEATQGSLNTFFFGWVLAADTWLTCYMVWTEINKKIIDI